MGLGKLILRATLGGYFVGHGMRPLSLDEELGISRRGPVATVVAMGAAAGAVYLAEHGGRDLRSS
jgi:hypothetical protein